MPWTDVTGNYPEWLEEYWALEKESEAGQDANLEPIHHHASDFSLPTLSFLVECLQALRNEPDLMGKIRDLKREHPNLEDLATNFEDLAIKIVSELSYLINMYLRWLEIKSGQDNLGEARAQLFAILAYRPLHEATPAEDADAIREEVSRNSYIDDLIQSPGRV